MNYSDSFTTDGKSSYKINATPKQNVKIACFNPESEQLEYHLPINASLYNYNGEMHHYSNNKIDIKVTPNHKMWVSKREYEFNGHRSKRKTKWGNWLKIESRNLDIKDYSRFRSKINWIGNDDIKTVNVIGKEVPIELYLEFLGYFLSEGWTTSNGKSSHIVGICQSTKKHYDIFKKCADEFSKAINKSYSSLIQKKKNVNHCDMWAANFCGKPLYEHFKNEVADINGSTLSENKKMPEWVKKLSPRLLKILLDAMVLGDGSTVPSQISEGLTGFAYYSTSKQLADDVYEIVYKCGFTPTVFKRDAYDNKLEVYTVLWSNTGVGDYPLVYKTSRNSRTKEKKNLLKIEQYTGKIWCFEVPTGLFITRRNGKITIQGNSAQNDKDFKIFTHEGVTVEKVGSSSGIYDMSGDITQLIKEIFIGLQVPPVLMDGGGETTYANGSVALDLQRQRYMTFRNMLSSWLKRKIFAPISKLNEFYEYKGAEKHLIIPEIDWNHMSLFDTGDYINNLVTLTTAQGEEQRRVSLHTLYRSLGLEWDDEQRKTRKEAISMEIAKKEKAALAAMDLNALRALGEDDEISEPNEEEAAVPGQQGPGGGGGGAAGMPDLGAPPGMPEPPK
jgi:hypothetical protein